MLQSLISVVNISHCGCWIENDSIYPLKSGIVRERLDLPAEVRDSAYRRRWISRAGKDRTGGDRVDAQRVVDGKACERCSRSVNSCPSSWGIGCLRLR